MIKDLKKYTYMIILGAKYIKIFKNIYNSKFFPTTTKYKKLSHERQNYSNKVLKYLNISVKTIGELPERDKMVYAINHRSLLDIIVMEHIFSQKNKNGTWIAKQELFDAFYGEFFKNSGCVSVDLESKRGLVSFFKTIKKLLSKIDDLNIYIFPEGERNKKDELLPFQSGAEKIAKTNNLDIVMVYIDDKLEKVYKKSPFSKTKEVKVYISKPIKPDNLEENYHKFVEDIKK